MDRTPSTSEFDIVLDVFGQRLVTIFTQISFCFPAPADQNINGVQDLLGRGSQRLAEAFPWVAGQVVCENASPESTGTFKIRPLEALPKLVVKDLRDDPRIPSRAKLERRGYPINALDESLIAPRNTSSGRPGETIAEVFQLQATLIKEGLILTFLGQHQALDGIGLAEMIRLFSKACKNESFTNEELGVGNLSPDNIVPLCDDPWKPGPELAYNIVEEDPFSTGAGSARNKIPAESGLWSQFRIAAASAGRLKALANEHLPAGINHISTDDAISAFVWQSVTRARSARFTDSTPALFARAVDLRRYLDISPAHPGFIQSMTYHKFTVNELADGPLGPVAANLRTAVDPKTTSLPYHGRSFATLISRTPDKTKTSYLAGFDMSRDVMLSSWANQKSYEEDFGLGLGRPEAVRRPYFSSFPGLAYLLPKSPAGDIDVVVCLNEEDSNRLESDEQFARYASYVR